MNLLTPLDAQSAVEGEWWVCDCLRGDRNKHGRIIVRRDAVRFDRSASSAPMNDRPFPSLADPHGNWLHDGTTTFLSIARSGIEMLTTKTERAMVPMLAAIIFGKDHLTTVTTTKRMINLIFQLDLALKQKTGTTWSCEMEMSY